MPGKIQPNSATDNAGAARLSQTTARCEGMHYRASGTLLERPLDSNPYLDGSPDADAWAIGWELAELNSGGSVERAEAGCCASTGVILE